ncbi:MAG: bifunctional phosphoglucose/phosphomannose isomerase [bacterium]|nr:bifunctional phosphoglucose/phosphomannose isomerase [bacterium]
MKTRDAILGFSEQFAFDPVVEGGKLSKKEKFVLAGMGGSHLAGDILKSFNPFLDIVIHRDYGLPALRDSDLRERLFIASSYSGQTEEAISSFQVAQEKKLLLCAVSMGGRLLELAREHKVPFVQLPDTGIQPRSALGLSYLAILKVMGREEELTEAKKIGGALDPLSLEDEGRELASWLEGRVPVIYASERNSSLAYNWKVRLNETAKIPAFFNVFPELNHNEMTGFDVQEGTEKLASRFAFLILRDTNDHPKIQKRMEILKKLYEERGFPVLSLNIQRDSVLERVFTSILLADWTALALAEHYGTDPDEIPMVQQFKDMVE